jgi:hypothetical protein
MSKASSAATPTSPQARRAWTELCYSNAASLAPFIQAVQRDQLPQAILLTGRAGLGKKSEDSQRRCGNRKARFPGGR